MLPKDWNANIGKVTQGALMKASEAAIFTMKDIPGEKSSDIWHKLGVATTGGVSGFFGIAALTVELPVSTSIMLRSIAEIARSEGESVNALDTKMACLEVFALGGKNASDDAAESGYFAVRAALAKSVSDAAEHVARNAATGELAPAMIKLISRVAERFGVQVTQKAAAQAVPAIGAAGGAIVNTLFMSHFQDMTRGHFVVRKLARKYGAEDTQRLYESLPNDDD